MQNPTPAFLPDGGLGSLGKSGLRGSEPILVGHNDKPVSAPPRQSRASPARHAAISTGRSTRRGYPRRGASARKWRRAACCQINIVLSFAAHAPDAGAVGGVPSSRSGPAFFSKALYSADGHGYFGEIRSAKPGGALLVIGHNPSTEELGGLLISKTARQSASLLLQGFPTGALAQFEFDGPLLSSETSFLRPRGLPAPERPVKIS